MPHRILAWLAEPASSVLYLASACATALAGGLAWLWAQVAGAPTAPMFGGGAIFAGIVAIITACSPLILGALDRKSLRKSLRESNLARDRHKADADRLREYLVVESVSGRAKLPEWFHRPPSMPPAGTGEFEIISTPSDDHDEDSDES